MQPTYQACYDQARALLGDDVTAGGDVFTNQILQPHLAQSIRELYRVLRSTEDPFVLTDSYYLLPQNTAVLDPATAGLTNLQIPEWIEWQLAPVTAPAVTNCVVGTNGAGNPVATVTAPSHGFITGATVVCWNIGGFDQFNNPNNLWTISVIDANTFTLNGCTATGTYTSGGACASLNGQFTKLSPLDTLDKVNVSSGANPVTAYAWEGGVLRFYPPAQNMLMRIVYRDSVAGTTNSNAVIPIDDCQDYVATRTAGLAAGTRGGSMETARMLNEMAIGPAFIADGNGGILRMLVQTDCRNMQRRQYRHRPFRARRNRPDYLLF